MNPAPPPRVLFVSTQMEAAGVQGRATAMLRTLLEEGTEASLVFLYTKRPVFEGMPGVSSLSPTRPGNALDLIVIFFRLVSHVRRLRPTAIVGFAHYASPLAAVAGWLCGVPTRVGSQTNTPSSFGRLARALDWLCGTLGIYTANIAVSPVIEGLFARYPASYRARLRTIVNGTSKPLPSKDKAACRAAFGLPADAFTVVNCGRLSRAKNQQALIGMMERLPNMHLAILGEGELRPDLERQIAARGLGHRVSLLGEVPSARVPEFLRCGDVFAFPSLHEGHPVAVLEAMQAGLPVVVSDHPTVVAAVGDAGPALPLGDDARWVAAIAHLRDDAGSRAEAAERSLRRGALFTFEKMMNQYRLLWDQGQAASSGGSAGPPRSAA